MDRMTAIRKDRWPNKAEVITHEDDKFRLVRVEVYVKGVRVVDYQVETGEVGKIRRSGSKTVAPSSTLPKEPKS